MHVRLLATVVTAFLVLAVAGCGGDDDDAAAYFTQLDKIHGDFEDRGADVLDAETAKAGLEAFAAIYDDYVSELQDLSPPDEAADAHADIVALGEEGRDQFLELAEETADDADLLEIFAALDQAPLLDRIDAANCALVVIARQAGITLENIACR